MVVSSAEVVDVSEQIRVDFAREWGRIGAAWGVAPSTAVVQGYLLLRRESLTETDIRTALGLSHKAAFTALAECESWGLIEQVGPRRSGRRGPAGRAWVAVGDHWQWFLRVAAVRREREMAPILPLLDACLRRTEATGDRELTERVASLLAFTHLFDRGIEAVVETDAASIAHLFRVLGRLDPTTLRNLPKSLAGVPEEDLAQAATTLASIRPGLARRLIAVVGSRGVSRLTERFARSDEPSRSG